MTIKNFINLKSKTKFTRSNNYRLTHTPKKYIYIYIYIYLSNLVISSQSLKATLNSKFRFVFHSSLPKEEGNLLTTNPTTGKPIPAPPNHHHHNSFHSRPPEEEEEGEYNLTTTGKPVPNQNQTKTKPNTRKNPYENPREKPPNALMVLKSYII